MILHTFVKSFLIGFMVAIPVGPVGLLVIHRSLSLGWLRGLVSGVGAALADGCFSFLAAAGTIALMEWLENSKYIVRPLGGCLLMGIGIYFFLHRPKERKNDEILTSKYLHYYIWDFISTFFVTIMNPLTILAFAGILAGSTILGTDMSTPIPYFEIVTGITAGSFCWWTILVLLAQPMKKMSLQAEKKLHQVVGCALILVGITGLLSTWIKF